MSFSYAPSIIQNFPAVCGGVILARGLTGGKTSAGLAAAYATEQQATLARLGDMPLAEMESLAAWRQAFRQFGVNPTKTRSACEALLRRLTKRGGIPSINRLVDIGNLVSIRYALPVAVFDLRAVTGEVVVRHADGSERFRELGSDDVKHPEPGEVIFVDETGMVIARRWCWRQSAESAARADTTDALVTVEAQHAGGRTQVERAVADLQTLLAEHVGGALTPAVLDADSPSFDSGD